MQGRKRFIGDGRLENRALPVPCQQPVRLLATIATISHTLHAVGTGR